MLGYFYHTQYRYKYILRLRQAFALRIIVRGVGLLTNGSVHVYMWVVIVLYV